MKVKSLKKHRNAHGDKFEKPKGVEYDHPSPEADIKAGFVKEVTSAEGKGKAPQK